MTSALTNKVSLNSKEVSIVSSFSYEKRMTFISIKLAFIHKKKTECVLGEMEKGRKGREGREGREGLTDFNCNNSTIPIVLSNSGIFSSNPDLRDKDDDSIYLYLLHNSMIHS